MMIDEQNTKANNKGRRIDMRDEKNQEKEETENRRKSHLSHEGTSIYIFGMCIEDLRPHV